MLQKIRDSKGLGRNILIGIIILVFALWGVESIVGSLFSSGGSIRVNGTEISEAAIEQAYQQQYRQMLQNLGPDADPSTIDEDLLRELSINELIQRELLNQVAREHDMQISSTYIDRQIITNPAFQVGGTYSDDVARALLSNAGFSIASFRAAMAEDERLNQILQGYAGSGFVTTEEVERFAALAQQTRNVRYLTLDFFDQSMEIEVTDQEVTDYYEQNQDEFIRDEQVAVDYLLLSRTDLMDEVEVTEEQIAARYEEERSSFEAQTERRASHILLLTEDGETEEAMAEAEALKERIDAGESFEDLAAEYSDDTSTSDTGGDLGYSTGDIFPEPLEEALRDLEVEQVSDPVVSEFGVHLVKLTEVIAGEFASLEESRERIREEIQLEAATEIYEQKREQLEVLAFETFDLVTPSEELELPILSTAPFTRQGGSGPASNPAFIEAAFSDDVVLEDLNSDTITLDSDTTAVIHLSEHLPPAVRPLEEVRVQIELLLRQQKVREQARTTGEELLASLENGESITERMEELGVTWVDEEELNRQTTGINPELRDWLFTLPTPGLAEYVYDGTLLTNGNYVVARLSAVTPGNVDSLLEADLEGLKTYISQQTGVEDRASLMADLQAKADIKRR